MPWIPPTPAEVSARGEREGLPVTEAEAELYARVAAGFSRAHDAVESWHEATRPVPPRN